METLGRTEKRHMWFNIILVVLYICQSIMDLIISLVSGYYNSMTPLDFSQYFGWIYNFDNPWTKGQSAVFHVHSV